MERMTTDRRHAARLVRLLRPGATRAGAWVSSEAHVRMSNGDRPLDPAVVVVAGELPYDGVTDDVPLLVVEVHRERIARWPASVPAVWGPDADGTVIVVESGVRRIVGGDEVLRVPKHPALALRARDLLHAAE